MASLGVVLGLVLVAGTSARVEAAPALTPKAAILVDADTGNVLSGTNIHEPLPPASLSKVFTALAAVNALPPHTDIPVSARAAGMPAHNMNMKEGQVWVLEDVLSALLVSSANDAGMALAERVSGTAEAFSDTLSRTASWLGLADEPDLRDPSGLDDEFSVGGGNKVSARDLAIAARAVLAQPRLAPIVASRVVSFTGGDGIAHRLGNHNRLLTVYQGAIGMKTGYTKRSLHSLIAAATRNGRTMIAVIVGHPGETYTPASALLDQGFATPVTAEPTSEHLPPVPSAAPVTQNSGATQRGSIESAAGGSGAVTVAAVPAHRGWLLSLAIFLLKVILGLAATVAILRIRVRHKAATKVAAPRTRELPKIDLRDRPPRPPARLRPLAVQREAEAPALDPRLAQRFEILVRTGQVVR